MEWLGIGFSLQLLSAAGGGAQDRIYDSALAFRSEFNRLMDRRVFGRFSDEELIQAEMQQIAKIGVHSAASKVADPKIEQAYIS